jgi:hypothetical protein
MGSRVRPKTVEGLGINICIFVLILSVDAFPLNAWPIGPT